MAPRWYDEGGGLAYKIEKNLHKHETGTYADTLEVVRIGDVGRLGL